MSGYNQTVSRPGTLPTWPAASPLDPAGLLQYLHPAGAGHEVYQLPVSRLNGAKAGAVVDGVAQAEGVTFATSSSTAGSRTLTLASSLLSAPIVVTAVLADDVNTANAQALALRTLLIAAVADDAVAAANFVVATTANASVLVTAKKAAADDATFTVTQAGTGLADTTVAAHAGTAGVAGTTPDFLGQLAIDGSTVKVATNLLLNTWTAVN